MSEQWDATPTSDSLLLCLNTYPKFNNNEFIKSIDKNFGLAKTNRINTFSNIDTFIPSSYDYYNPIHFHLWSSWDICSLVRIDGSYQITKMLHSQTSEQFSNNSSRLLNGISFEEYGMPLKNLTDDQLGVYIAITNLKLSNKWLLKNGYNFIVPVLKKINEKLKDKKYFIFQSYSSYEISLVVFENKLSELSSLIFNVRETLVKELELQDNFNILYGNDNQNSNVFSDSNTLFGARLSLNDDGDYEIQKGIDEEITVSYEFEVKPCKHKRIKYFIDNELDSATYSKPGKYDIITDFKKINTHSLNISEKIRNEEETKNSIRKLKTNLLFIQSPKEESEIHDNKIRYDFKFEELNSNLKQLKVSKTIRNQILRMNFAFKNQIHDTINLNLFLDIYPFIKYVGDDISRKAKKISAFFDQWNNKLEIFDNTDDKHDDDNNTVAKTENILKGMIKTFNDSYYLRYVNDHSFIEDLPDFLISHNAQYQTLASIYDNCTKKIAKLILGDDGYNILTTFDDSITEINAYNLKLSTYILFEPSLVFSLTTKEIINIFVNKNFNKLKERDKIYRDTLINYYKSNPDCPSIVLKNNILQYSIDYLYNDYMRLKLFYNNNFELFYYSFLANLVQLPALYSTKGGLDRNLLVRELVRIRYLILTLDQKEQNYLINLVRDNAPSREVRSEWNFAFNLLDYYFNNANYIDIANDEISKENFLILDEKIKEINSKSEFSSFKKKLDFIQDVFINDSQCPAFLGRNWKGGDIVKNIPGENNPFFFYENNPYFLYDPQGGVFFYNFERMTEYSKKRNQMMMILYDDACKIKGEIFDNLQSKEN